MDGTLRLLIHVQRQPIFFLFIAPSHYCRSSSVMFGKKWYSITLETLCI